MSRVGIVACAALLLLSAAGCSKQMTRFAYYEAGARAQSESASGANSAAAEQKPVQQSALAPLADKSPSSNRVAEIAGRQSNIQYDDNAAALQRSKDLKDPKDDDASSPGHARQSAAPAVMATPARKSGAQARRQNSAKPAKGAKNAAAPENSRSPSLSPSLAHAAPASRKNAGASATQAPAVMHTPEPSQPAGAPLEEPAAKAAADTAGASAAPQKPAFGTDARSETSQNPEISDENRFRWPVKGRIISSFGEQIAGERNDGINLAVPEGTEIRAVADGTIIYSGNKLKGYGDLVLIRHDDVWVSAYAHNSRILVKRGQSIRRGDVISHSGSSGAIDRPQLHFELRKNRVPVDPESVLGAL